MHSPDLPLAGPLFDAHPDPQWLVDVVHDRVLAVNQAALRLTGLTHARFMADTRIRCADGRLLDVPVTTADLLLNGRPARLSVVRQVTGEDPAFRALAEQMPALIYRACIAPPHRSLYVSPFVSHLGMTPQQWMASPDAWVGAMHPDDRERVLEAFRTTYPGGDDLCVQYRMRDAHGRWLHFRDASRRVVPGDGSEPYIQGIALDVTDLVDIQEALRASEKRWRLSEQRYRLASSHGQVWDWDPALSHLQVHADFWHHLGYEPPAASQVIDWLRQLMHPEDQARWTSAIEAHFKWRTPYSVQFRLRDARDDWRWIETTGQAIWDLQGKVTYMAGTASDITARKRAETALMTYQMELSDLTQRLMQQERTTTQRVAQALHDRLGQTLAVVRLHLEAARGDPGPGDPTIDGAELLPLPSLIDSAVKELRQALTDLRPPPLHEKGLVAWLENESLALTSAARDVDVLLEVDESLGAMRWPPDVEYAAFMVAREAADHAIAHAGAHLVRIVIEGGPGRLQLDVIDDGQARHAPAPAFAHDPAGIVGLRERAFSVHARLGFHAEPEGGHRVRLVWETPTS